MYTTKTTKIILAFIVLFFGFVSRVDAHTLKTDGSIGTVLHITPDDDPISGQKSEFFFDFKDTNGKFKTGICNCKVSIIKSNIELYSQPLPQTNDSSENTAVFIYTFPEPGIYQVKLSGKPLLENTFESFTLTYDIRVDRETLNQKATTSTKPQSLPYILYAVLAIAFGIFVLVVFVSWIKKSPGKLTVLIITAFVYGSSTFYACHYNNILTAGHNHTHSAEQHDQSHLPCCMPTIPISTLKYSSISPTFSANILDQKKLIVLNSFSSFRPKSRSPPTPVLI